jgi:hypothetical protein
MVRPAALLAGCALLVTVACGPQVAIEGAASALAVEAHGCGPRPSQGAGSVVADRLAITAAHVLAGATSIEVEDADGASTSAEVVVFDPALDLAVLRLASALGEPTLPRVDPAVEGERGVVIVPDRDVGRFEVVEIEVLRAVDIRTTDIYLDEEVLREGFEIDAPIDEGDSGAVVILPGGAAGMVWARSNQRARRAWAIDITAASSGTDLELLTEPTRRTPVDVGPCIR